MDHVAISRLVNRYCTILDRMELDCLDEVFTEDCRVAYGRDDRLITRTRAELRAALRRLWRFSATSHHASNIDVRAIDANTASVESYVIAWHRSDEGGDAVIYGQYSDEVVRTGAGWRIRKRVMAVQGASSSYEHPLYRSRRNLPETGWEESLKGWS